MQPRRAGEWGNVNCMGIVASCLMLALVALIAACGGVSTAPRTGLAATAVATLTATPAATSPATVLPTATAATRMPPTATPRTYPPTPTPTPKPPPSSAVTVDIIGTSSFAFSPVKITIKVGTKVKWVDETAVIHTSTSTSGPASWDSGTINPGGAFTFTFTTPGMYTYHCLYHPSMAYGTIVVTS